MKTSAINLFQLINTGNPFCRYLILACTLLSISCSKDDFSPDLDETPAWEPEIAFPLAYTEIGISDLVHENDSSTNIISANDQFCTLIYQGNVFHITADQIAHVPDQSHQSQISLNNSQILTLVNSGQVQVTTSQDVNFSISQGLEIDSMVIKNSWLHFDINSGFPANAEARVIIPGLKKNGIVFSELIQLNYSGSMPTVAQFAFPLNDYHMDMTKNGTSTNTLEINYTITFTGNGANVTTANSININAEFRSVAYKILYGFIGQQNIGNLRDSVELTIYNNALGTGSFSIADPEIRFDISNSMGVPLNARIAQLTALNGNMTNFTVATGLPDPLPVYSPGAGQEGQTLYSSFTMNKSNSNISALIGQQPKYLITSAQITTNPSGQGINFLTDTSHITMNATVELPLQGTASDFIIKDTVPFNYHDLDKVENLTLRMNVENWFPIDASIQLIFTDDNFNPVDTIFVAGEVVIPSGIITGNNERVTIAGTKIHDHLMDQSRISTILNARHIVVEAKATTFQQGIQEVKIFSDYKLKLKFGAIARMKIQ